MDQSKPKSAKPVAQQQTQQMQQQAGGQSQQQGQGVPAARPAFLDPLGRPLYQGAPRFTDQQAGGDLTGDESDARDDNFVATGMHPNDNARDVSAHPDRLAATSTELLRSASVAPDKRIRPAAAVTAAPALEPDGTEDPGANADDGLVPRQHDGSASEQH